MRRDSAPFSVEELLAQSSWLRHLATTLVSGEAAAEDLVQETWLAALRNPPGEVSLRPWLARIARNLASNFRRAETRRREHEEQVHWSAPELDPGAVIEEVEAQRVLVEAVLALEEPLRTAVVLRHLRGLDSRAIGRLQGVPAGTVRWRLKRALELLRAGLDRRFGGRRAWCSAFAALVPEGTTVITTSGASLAKATFGFGGTAAMAAAGFLALFGAAWLAMADEPRPEASLASMAALDEWHAPDAGSLELVRPALDELSGTERSLRVEALPVSSGVTSGAGLRRRAPIRGQLRIAGSEDVLDEALTVHLRTGDLSVKETVRTTSGGSFTSKRPFPRGFVLAEVLRPAGDPAFEAEGFFDPSSDEDWPVLVAWPNFVRGRLIDGQGRPLTEAEVRLFEGRTEKHQDRNPAGESGTFSFSDLGLGPCKVSVRRGFQHHQFTVEVARGPNELGDVVVPFHDRVGPISGRVSSAPGSPQGRLVLTDLASGESLESVTSRDSEGISRFEFADVPAGKYRLTLFPCDDRRYFARTRFVSPPMTDVEFSGSEEFERLWFHATDAESGQEIDAYPLVLQSGRWCGPEVSCEPADVQRWVLVAKGHRPASGWTLERARVDERLEPGWGCALFFVEGLGSPELGTGTRRPVRGPIAGVEVRIDGQLLARSDQDGLALVSLPRMPGQDGDAEALRLECRLDSWVLDDGDLLVDDYLLVGSSDVYAFTVLRRE